MTEEKKDEKVVVVGTKKWQEAYKKVSELHERVKDINIVKPTGMITGKLAAKLIKPFAGFVSGVKEGWKGE